jgi:hypothetical protein
MFSGNTELDMGFIILSPEPNIGRLKGTVRSIKNNYSQDARMVCVVEKGTKKPEIDEMKEVCPTFRGGQTVTSLINTGFKNAGTGWNMLIMEGAWLPAGVKFRYSRWIKSEKDILFPIVVNYDRDGHPTKVFGTFSECTINGILADRDFFLGVGKLTENPLKISREFWAMDAVNKGALFKGILGIKIC